MDLDYIEQLLMILKDMEYSDLTLEDLKQFHDEMLGLGLLPKESSEAHFVSAILEVTGKNDLGKGSKTDLWGDKDDLYDVDFLIYNEWGEKLKLKDHKNGKMLLKDAVKEAERMKKDYDANKVIVIERITSKMLARITTKGAGKPLDMNLKPLKKEEVVSHHPIPWSYKTDGFKPGMKFKKNDITITIKKLVGDELHYVVDYGSGKQGQFDRDADDVANMIRNENMDRIK